jgi:uncharacterized protein (TIGR02145 family)
MNTKSFNRRGRALLLAAAVTVLAAFGARAQYDTATVPFYIVEPTVVVTKVAPANAVVNDTTMYSAIASSTNVIVLIMQKAKDVTNNIYFLLPKSTRVLSGAQKQANAPALVGHGDGKVTLNLPAQSYKNAEITLYSVNGKRILRKSVSALSAVNNISRQNVATGAYLLSVTGTDGAAFSSRLTHSGGNLDITVAFGGGNRPAARQSAKEAAAGEWAGYWNVTVSCNGYADTVFAIRPVKGTNPQQTITLRELPKYPVTVTSAGTGATGGGSYAAGAAVSIGAGTAPAGQQFKNWTTTSNGVTFANANSAATTFTMPANAVTVTANFEAKSVTSTYLVTVASAGTGATGGGSYAAGEAVSINAGTAPAGQRFKNWTTASNGVIFADANSAATSFTMPANTVTVTANFESISVTPGLDVPANVTAVWVSATSVTLSWSAVSGATGYFVYRASSANGEYSRLTITTSTTYTHTVSTLTTYYYKVSAFDGNSESAPSYVYALFGYSPGTLVDDRDGKTYKYVTIGYYNMAWMAENLNFDTLSSGYNAGSWCYGNKPDSCAKYGRLYDWYTAKTVCPAGWHLPTRQEWGELAIAAGGTGDYGASGPAGASLKSTTGWRNGNNGTDKYGFKALPGGDRGTDGSFGSAGNYGSWWTATEYGSGYAYYRGMYYNFDYVSENDVVKSRGFSVRCRRD